MLDLEQAKKDALEYVRKTYHVIELSEQAKEDGEFDVETHIWDVKTEYFQPDGTTKPVGLRVFLPSDFPLVLPVICVNTQFINEIGYLPHINSGGIVCLYDTTSITLNSNKPGEIVTSAIYRAISIIEDGLSRKNTVDFADEFVAYWSEQYAKNDKHEKGLCMVGGSEQMYDKLKIIVFDKPFNGFKLILHDEGDDYKTFRKYLKEYKSTGIEHPVFYLGTTPMITPPFNLTNGEIAAFLKREFSHRECDFEKFVNENPYPIFLLFSLKIGDSLSYFGWHLSRVNNIRPGFRPGVLKALTVLTSFQRNEIPARVVLENYTSKRLRERTSGTSASKRYKFAIAGLGSIGSNLIPVLTSLESEHLSLIDFDVLKIENINRHLLGMSYVGLQKTKAMKAHLQFNDPLLKVNSYQSSVIEVLAKRPDILNDSDVIIVAIGINNIEEHLAVALAEGKIIKPIFFFWVEPYLMGGHCLYLTPSHKVDFGGLFQDGLYKYNMISRKTYKDPIAQIKLREAGCQTSYIPYGKQSIMRFISGIVPAIYKIIEERSNKDVAISWRNSINVIDGFGIELSDIGKTLGDYQIQVNTL